jgi:hypothetical protein
MRAQISSGVSLASVEEGDFYLDWARGIQDGKILLVYEHTMNSLQEFLIFSRKALQKEATQSVVYSLPAGGGRWVMGIDYHAMKALLESAEMERGDISLTVGGHFMSQGVIKEVPASQERLMSQFSAIGFVPEAIRSPFEGAAKLVSQMFTTPQNSAVVLDASRSIGR